MYKGQYQLGTVDAMYSDGRRYRPVLVAAEKLKHHLSKVKSVLVLGAGIGSVIDILSHKGHHPEYTLVDIDNTVLDWVTELQPADDVIHTVCADALLFMKDNDKKYDLLFVDVFSGRVVPQFVTSQSFIEKCHRGINPGGYFVMNYIINDESEWKNAERIIKSVFPSSNIYPLEVNRIIIASV